MPWTNLTGAGTWTGVNWMAVASGSRIDPYMVWAEATGFSDLGGVPAAAVPVLIELGPGADIPRFAAAIAGLFWLTIPAIYTAPAPALAATRFFSATASVAFFQQFAAGNALLADVLRCEIGMPVDTGRNVSHAGIDPAAFPATTGVTGLAPSAVIAIIDDGLPFANSRFFDAGGDTRIRFFWDQTLAAGPATAPAGAAAGVPPELGYGCELKQAHIQAALAATTSGGSVDEEMLYARAGYSRVRRRQTHGSAVMDLACGPNPPGFNRIPDARVLPPEPAVICVQLPSLTVADTSGASLGVHLLDALRYIIARADMLGPNLPVVVNLSFGRIAGAPDGSSLICAAMDELINMLRPRLKIVVAAGNNYLARAHARFTLPQPPKTTQELLWRVQPGDATPNFMEIWVADSGKIDFAQLSIEVRPPGSAATAVAIGANQAMSWTPVAAGAAVCTVVFTTRPAGAGTGWVQILIAMEPTAALGPRDLAPCGLWSVVVDWKGKDDLRFDAWIQRDDTPYGYARRGRQSYFDDPAYACFDLKGQRCEGDNMSYVKREGTLNALARGASVEVVGSSIGLPVAAAGSPEAMAAAATGAVAAGAPAAAPGAVANYSSAGQNVPSVVRSPNRLTPGEDSIVQHGVLAAGTHSNSFSALAGSSVAAPQISWYLATATPLTAVAAAAAVVAQQRDAAGKSIPALPARGPAVGTIGRRVTQRQRGAT